jgi:hypothetical protein
MMQTDVRVRKHADIKLTRLLAIDEHRLTMFCRDDVASAAGVQMREHCSARVRAAKYKSESKSGFG